MAALGEWFFISGEALNMVTLPHSSFGKSSLWVCSLLFAADDTILFSSMDALAIDNFLGLVSHLEKAIGLNWLLAILVVNRATGQKNILTPPLVDKRRSMLFCGGNW